MKTRSTMFAALLCATCAAAMADSIPYPNQGVIPTEHVFYAQSDGDLQAYFLGSNAAYNEELGVFVNGVQLGPWALQNHSSAIADSITFGSVKAGDKLVFALRVNEIDQTFYSSSSMNSDGINHLYATSFSGQPGDPELPSAIYLGFEDAPQFASDLNYQDETVLVTNTVMDAAPEPGTTMLLAIGILTAGALGFVRKKQ